MAPDWDQQSDSDESEVDMQSLSINDDSYPVSNFSYKCPTMSNSLTIGQFNQIIPVPSQILVTMAPTGRIPITLDSGATLSFIRFELVNFK